MDAVGTVTSAAEKLVAEFACTWPAHVRSVPGLPGTPAAMALQDLVALAQQGKVTTLPYVQATKQRVFWLSFGKDTKALLDYADDLKSWIVPAWGTDGGVDFVQPGSPGRLAGLVAQASPSGYLRWSSDLKHLDAILQALVRMHTFLEAMPEVKNAAAPSLHILRFRFVTALRLGEWTAAEASVDEIDRWNLEQAHKTMQMRVRVLSESGEHARLLELVERHQLWMVMQPSQVSLAILRAVHSRVLAPLVLSGQHEAACSALAIWYPKLVHLLPAAARLLELAPLQAYAACIAADVGAARRLLPQLDDALAVFVRGRLMLADEQAATAPVMAGGGAAQGAVTPPASEGEHFWQAVMAAVCEGNSAAVRRQLEELDARVLNDAGFLAATPDALLELLSNPSIETSAASRVALQDVLTGLVDAAVGVPGFPRTTHLDLYVVLAEALVYLRGESASEQDAHLLHGLLAAAMNLSSSCAQRCSDLLRDWWRRRPTGSRIGWLVAALDSVGPLHPRPHDLCDLWVEAVALAARKRLALTAAEVRTWRRVGAYLELPAATVNADLADLQPQVSTPTDDQLARAQLRKVAIISLQEAAAREAARELQSRTGAEVLLITSLVQDGFTNAAKDADVILFVWAACSHAVYRAFDDCRDKVAYVQGTGASSIIAAAEVWVARHRLDNSTP